MLGTLGYKIRLEQEMLFLVLTWEHADLHISRVCSVYQNVQSPLQRQNSLWLSLPFHVKASKVNSIHLES